MMQHCFQRVSQFQGAVSRAGSSIANLTAGSMTYSNNLEKIENDKSGFRFATSVGGGATGEGGDYVVVDDPHKIEEAPSKIKREAVLHWWDHTMYSRLNDQVRGKRLVVMQRVHMDDLAGHLMEAGGWEVLKLPTEFNPKKRCQTSIGWKDPRHIRNQLLCPERFPRHAVG